MILAVHLLISSSHLWVYASCHHSMTVCCLLSTPGLRLAWTSLLVSRTILINILRCLFNFVVVRRYVNMARIIVTEKGKKCVLCQACQLCWPQWQRKVATAPHQWGNLPRIFCIRWALSNCLNAPQNINDLCWEREKHQPPILFAMMSSAVHRMK